MALKRKNLTLDAAQLHELAERRDASESSAAREAIAAALFADEFVDILRQLHAAGFGVVAPDDEEAPAEGPGLGRN